MIPTRRSEEEEKRRTSSSADVPSSAPRRRAIDCGIADGSAGGETERGVKRARGRGVREVVSEAGRTRRRRP